MRRISLVFALATIALLGWAAVMALKPPPSRIEMVVGECDRDLGETPVGESILVFRVTNPSDRPGRIIGLQEG